MNNSELDDCSDRSFIKSKERTTSRERNIKEYIEKILGDKPLNKKISRKGSIAKNISSAIHTPTNTEPLPFLKQIHPRKTKEREKTFQKDKNSNYSQLRNFRMQNPSKAAIQLIDASLIDPDSSELREKLLNKEEPPRNNKVTDLKDFRRNLSMSLQSETENKPRVIGARKLAAYSQTHQEYIEPLSQARRISSKPKRYGDQQGQRLYKNESKHKEERKEMATKTTYNPRYSQSDDDDDEEGYLPKIVQIFHDSSENQRIEIGKLLIKFHHKSKILKTRLSERTYLLIVKIIELYERLSLDLINIAHDSEKRVTETLIEKSKVENALYTANSSNAELITSLDSLEIKVEKMKRSFQERQKEQIEKVRVLYEEDQKKDKNTIDEQVKRIKSLLEKNSEYNVKSESDKIIITELETKIKKLINEKDRNEEGFKNRLNALMKENKELQAQYKSITEEFFKLKELSTTLQGEKINIDEMQIANKELQPLAEEKKQSTNNLSIEVGEQKHSKQDVDIILKKETRIYHGLKEGNTIPINTNQKAENSLEGLQQTISRLERQITVLNNEKDKASTITPRNSKEIVEVGLISKSLSFEEPEDGEQEDAVSIGNSEQKIKSGSQTPKFVDLSFKEDILITNEVLQSIVGIEDKIEATRLFSKLATLRREKQRLIEEQSNDEEILEEEDQLFGNSVASLSNNRISSLQS